MADNSMIGRKVGSGTALQPARKFDENLKSLAKVVRILDCFSFNDRTLSLQDVSERTGLPRSTAHRLMASMRELGFLDQDNERDRYRLGLKLFELGSVALSNLDLLREARPIVETLQRMIGQSVHLAVFDGARAVVIHRADKTASPTGGGLIENAPAHCTSVGKAILAYQSDDVIDRLIASGLQRFTETTIVDGASLKRALADIRAQGFSIDEAEHQPGVRCIGAPIRNGAGQVFAGVSMSGPSWDVPVANIPELAKVVIHHANAISQRIGWSG